MYWEMERNQLPNLGGQSRKLNSNCNTKVERRQHFFKLVECVPNFFVSQTKSSLRLVLKGQNTHKVSTWISTVNKERLCPDEREREREGERQT